MAGGNPKGITNMVLEQFIIENSYDSIFVTDNNGVILMANPAASRLLGINQEDLVGANVGDLVEQGYYDRSTVMDAIEGKKVVTGLIRTKKGTNLMSTSSPLFDDNGQIIMVITNSRDKDIVDKFMAKLENERELNRRYRTQLDYLRNKDFEKEKLVARSWLMRQVILKANTVARVDSTVMLTGESGTGKEVIARYIHLHSNRCQEAFIPVNCAAIPEPLLESELFGYEKGAFTGANTKGKPGLFEVADKGTIFLDEIGELPIALQPKLLRVLETSEVRRIGGTASRKIDVRIIGATNRDLAQMVQKNEFRDDLFYRLNVIPINIPPLRERPEDIVALSEKFLGEFNKKYGYDKNFSRNAVDAFLRYRWPGNVRELRNVVERLVITTSGDEITIEEEHNPVRTTMVMEPGEAPAADSCFQGSLREVVQAVEDRYIRQVLDECQGRVGEAAKKLGIHRTVLYRKLHRDGSNKTTSSEKATN